MQKRNTLNIAITLLSTLQLCCLPGFAEESQQSNDQSKADIEKLLGSFEHDWNAHNLEAVMSYYADDYVNNDGFDKKSIEQLTKDLWDAYPNVKSSSRVKQIRVEGPYATVESKDEAVGASAEELPGLGTKGELKSQSEGQLYLKQIGPRWRIIGDRIDFEKIRLSYGLARQLDPVFAAPEQVRSGTQYSAKLELELPTGLAATGAISQTAVSFPLPKKVPDKYKQIGDPITEHPRLERVMTANSKNRNELLMASIALTNASGNSIMGYLMLTRRLNVIPVMEQEPKPAEDGQKAEAPKSEHEHPEASGVR